MGRDGNLCMGKVIDLAQTHTSMANDMASDGVWKSEGRSDAGLVHRGDGVDCLLGATCRHWHSAGVPAMMRRVGPRIARGARGGHGSWGRGREPSQEVGSKHRVLADELTKVLPNLRELFARKGGLAHRHSREGQSRR